MGRFLPPDHDAGDANTIGGYAAVHSRPAAFEGKDNESYSVEIVTDSGTFEHEGTRAPWAGYLLFIRWGHGDPVAAGHLETEYLFFGADEASVRAQAGATELRDAKRWLDVLIDRDSGSSRPWYEAMRDA